MQSDLWFEIRHEKNCEFSPNHSKVQSFDFDELFLFKAYKVWAKKIQRNYISWYWTV